MIHVDLQPARRMADAAVAVLEAMFATHDVARFAYTHAVRVAPLVVPHSHPVLTLNTRLANDPPGLLRVWLHEQMHWYAAWCARRHPASFAALLDVFDAAYPAMPVGPPDGAHTRESTRLHLVVNRLEIIAAGSVFGEAETVRAALAEPRYRWCYAVAVSDASALDAALTAAGVLPMVDATTWSDTDRALAADAPSVTGTE